MFQFIIILSVLCSALAAALPAGQEKVPLPDGRIVGGKSTTVQEFPWQVSIRHNGIHLCGGSIYNASIVITAAHCINVPFIDQITIVAGITFVSDVGVELFVKRVAVHSKFDSGTMDSDIAVLFLNGTLPLSDSIAPIDLPEANEVLRKNAVALISGWGHLNESGHAPDQLQYVTVNVIDRSKCKIAYKDINKVLDSMICAGAKGRDSCQGDSGGPFVVNNKLFGIVSWGLGCARVGYPGVYTNVRALRGWLDEVFQGNI